MLRTNRSKQESLSADMSEELSAHATADLDWTSYDPDWMTFEDVEAGRRWYEVRTWFKSGPDYKNMGRYEKMHVLWGALVPDESVTDVEPSDFLWKDFPDFFTVKGDGAFWSNSDVLIWDKKVVHKQGVVAKVEWIPVENDLEYPGLYESGSDSVIMRLSETANQSSETKGLTPSVALKFLTGGELSANILAMNSMAANEGSWNFFEKTMKTRVPAFTKEDNPIEFETFHRKLLHGTPCPYALAVGHLAEWNNDEGEYTNKQVKIPYELQFESKFKEDLDDPAIADLPWYRQLQAKIPKDSIILDVYALTAPTWFEGSERVKIAEIKLLTELYTSQFGDDVLQFQHIRIRRDRKHWPKEWRQDAIDAEDCTANHEHEKYGKTVPEGVWPDNDADAKEFFEEQQREYGCPFAWLMK